MNESQEQLHSLLSDYVEGNLAGEQLASVEAYLENNPGVRDTVNRLMVDSEALRSLPRVAAPFDFSEDVRGQLERDLLLDSGNMAHPRRRRISSVVASVAALLIVFLGLGGGAYWMLANRPAPFFDVAINTSAKKKVEADSFAEEKSVVEEKSAPADEAARRDVDLGSGPIAFSRTAGDHDKREAEAVSPAATPALAGGVMGGASALEEPDSSPLLGHRAEIPSVPPDDVVQLVDEAPRYSRRAVAVVIDAKDAGPASQAVSSFLATNPVKTETLSYDATRNRATPAQKVRDALADVGPRQQVQESQISGALSNSSVSSIAQAMQSTQFSASLPEPQVVMAIGLTNTQFRELKESLQKDLGPDRVPTYELAESRRIALGAATKFDVGNDEAAPVESSTKPLPTSRPALVAAGDRLIITLSDSDAGGAENRLDSVVDADGMIVAPEIGSIHAAGMTIQALRQTIVEQYVLQRQMRDPVVNIEIAASQTAAQPHDSAVANAASEATPDGKGQPAIQLVKSATADLVDVYLVVRPQAPSTQPTVQSIPAPTTQPR